MITSQIFFPKIAMQAVKKYVKMVYFIMKREYVQKHNKLGAQEMRNEGQVENVQKFLEGEYKISYSLLKVQ